MKPSHNQAIVRLIIAIGAFLVGGVVAEARIKYKLQSMAAEEGSASTVAVSSSASPK